MTSTQVYHQLMANKLIEEFSKRNIEACYCEHRKEALEKIKQMIPKNSKVSVGGSETLKELNIPELLRNKEYNFLDPHARIDVSEKEQVAHEALGADYYLMSTNAITENGELVNIDGIGNRVAALIFGPKNVIVVAGMNKVVPDIQSAIQRAQGYAARMCLLLFKKDYTSFEELSIAAKNAKSQLVVTSMSSIKNRIKVILVGENLGF